jgi:hypothetical protein
MERTLTSCSRVKLGSGFSGIFEIVAADKARGGRLKKETRLRGHRLPPLADPSAPLLPDLPLPPYPMGWTSTVVHHQALPPSPWGSLASPATPIDLGVPICPMDLEGKWVGSGLGVLRSVGPSSVEGARRQSSAAHWVQRNLPWSCLRNG